MTGNFVVESSVGVIKVTLNFKSNTEWELNKKKKIKMKKKKTKSLKQGWLLAFQNKIQTYKQLKITLIWFSGKAPIAMPQNNS